MFPWWYYPNLHGDDNLAADHAAVPRSREADRRTDCHPATTQGSDNRVVVEAKSATDRTA